MDLLQSYGSSDDDDGISDGDRSISPPTPIKKTTVHDNGALPPAVPSPQKILAKKPGTESHGKTNSRGKKLISLHSVLPPHILQQLTKHEATGSWGDSSDDDDADNSNNQIEPHEKQRAQSGKKRTPTMSQDPGIASFLSALSSAKTMNASTSLSKMNMKTNSSADSSKLGAAFVAVTSTTNTTRTKKDGTKQSIKSKVSSSSSNEPRLTPTGQAETGESSPSPSGYTPLSLSPRTAFHPFRTAGVAAAPPVPNALQFDNVPRNVLAPHPPPPMHTEAVTREETSIAQSGGGSSSSNRSKKRQLQKALRAGQLDEALAQSDNTASLEQAAPTAYVPQQETYAVPTNGVRVAATAMYNPKVGGDVQVNMGGVRARGKNQINQLMASAANFELQQARQGGKNSNQRAGAKRKYGW